ncbi:MAG TPA: hypothetical protein VL727_17600 [Puia sp.]|jgi:hypothetical protein|nr:hypothetical protein [Puia sp.]
MKKTVTPFLAFCLFSVLACHKDNAGGPGTTATGTLRINLIAGAQFAADNSAGSCELIISESAGKVLLDTVVPSYTSINTSLQTNDTLVDITNIFYNSYQHKYNATTYKAVNPTSWANDYNLPYYSPLAKLSSSSIAQMVYINMPDLNNFMFDQSRIQPIADTLDVLNHIAIGGYYYVPGNYAYMMCAPLGLYSMHIPKGLRDTVDCTHLDTAVAVTFTPSPYYSFSSSNLIGYPDTNNISTALSLYNYWANTLWSLQELWYPPKYFQKYALQTTFASNNKEVVTAYSYTSSISPNIAYPDPGSYAIGASQNDHFTVGWNAGKPTYYYTTWQDSTLTWTLYASPDSVTLDPLALLTTQSSKLLKGTNLSPLALTNFQFENVPGYNYSSFLALTCDSVLLQKTRVSGGISYNKSF